MRRLVRNAMLSAGRDDRGAVGVIVGVLIGGGVLLGMGALVIDVGQIYHERAQLQTGAEAGALAVARACASGSDDCSDSTASDGTAGTYANANAKDDKSAVDLVCGVDDEGVLSSCPPSTDAMTDCPDAPDSDVQYVDVHTSVRNANDSTLLPPSLSRTLAGNEDYPGTGIGACARVAWGGPAGMDTVAMTISYCEWNQATASGTKFAPPPPYPPNPLPDPSVDQQLKLHTTVEDTGCPGGGSGYDAPGAFGWVDDDDGDCQAFVDGDTYEANTGVSAGNSCKDLLKAAWENRTLLYIPVYKWVEGTGTNATYALEGFAAFVVTGLHLPGLHRDDWLNPALNCSDKAPKEEKGKPPPTESESDKCINGYFTKPLGPAPGEVGGPDLGVTVIQMTG
jgi:hypothetical protein